MNKLMKISFSLILMLCCLVMLPGCKKDEEYSNELKFKELKIYKEDGSLANSCTAPDSWCEAGNSVTFEYHQGEEKLTRSDSEPWNGLFADTFYIIGFTQDMEDDTLDDTVWSGGLYQKFVNEDSDLKYKRVGYAHFGSDSKGNKITVTFVSEGPEGRYEYTYTNY